ncbi:MAG: hypothetical protein ACKVRP_13370 [Bacteroidota bacterium]
MTLSVADVKVLGYLLQTLDQNTMKLSDTTPEAEHIQREILRKMSPEEKMQLTFDLIEFSGSLNAVGVRMRHPEYTDDEVRLAVIRLRLGDELFCKAYPAHKHVIP